jgi:hypothetical protein
MRFTERDEESQFAHPRNHNNDVVHTDPLRCSPHKYGSGGAADGGFNVGGKPIPFCQIRKYRILIV